MATNGCQIKSYINNAHPVTHRGLYEVIEKIITATISLWDESLRQRKYGGMRIPYRRVEYGEHPQPEPTQTYPDNPEDVDEDDDEESEERYWKWLQSRPIIQPEPGEFKVIESNERDRMNLREKFAKTGLQVIVKLANIELTPENPDYEGGAWHIEGQLNERICATAIYYYDSKNITESRLSFRQRGTNMDDVKYDQDCHEFLQEVYGLSMNETTLQSECTQNLGGVLCREGRLLTFPNVVQHKVSPFSLADRSQAGHRKVLALFLVDPARRIISSANVPPQQEDWAPKAGKLGSEQLEGPLVSDQGVRPTMTLNEAATYRLELMEERSVAGVHSKKLLTGPYGDWRDDLQSQGYAVIKNVIDSEKAQYYQQKALDWLSSFNPAFKLDDPTTWVNENLPIQSKVNTFNGYSVTHERFMWDARTEPKVLDAFAQIWGTDELLVSFDALNVTLPNRKDRPAQKPWPHVDQSPMRRGLHCVQGIINLSHAGPDDGSLMVFPRSNTVTEEFFDETDPSTWEQKDIRLFSEEEIEWFSRRGMKPLKVLAEPGDLIVWDSRTVHWGGEPTAASDTIRTVIYASYAPARLANEETFRLKREALTSFRATTHWAHENIVLRDQLVRLADGRVDPRSRTAPLKLPEYSDRMLRLAGVKSY
ncbi:unnamed protein product [Penicillium salamii]|nr:unnamed protein product [Penicillium salamii]CAG8353526.1 unnamed protein product [Penicillium salamii]